MCPGQRDLCPTGLRQRDRDDSVGAVRAEDFITGQFPWEQAEQAFEASMSGDHIWVLIHP